MTLTSELDDHRVEYGLQFWMCEDPPDTPDSLSGTISQYTVKNENTASTSCNTGHRVNESETQTEVLIARFGINMIRDKMSEIPHLVIIFHGNRQTYITNIAVVKVFPSSNPKDSNAKCFNQSESTIIR